MTTLQTDGISTDGVDVSVSIKTEGDEKAAETVHMHAHDEIAKALQAIENGVPPEKCEGYFVKPDWEARLEIIGGSNE